LCYGKAELIELPEVTSSDKTTFFKHLLSHNADINSIDKREVLCLGAKYDVVKDSLAWTINTVPGLMHQADIDGIRPLHHAIA
jgi:hypothetical protein